jgi:hypothetical protein
MMKFANLYILIFAWLYLVSRAIAQSTSVGNGSAIAPSAGQLENYGVNSQSPTANQNSFVTRHNRRGNNPGIGSSFLGTTSPTPEGSPATRPLTPSAPVSTMQFRSPKLESSFSQNSFNPALESFTPALPNLPRASNALSSPATSASTFGNRFGSPALENIPSFNKQPSLTDKMQFNSFDSFDK